VDSRLARALSDCLAQLQPGRVKHIAVALSGGLDSTLLAVYAAALAQRQGLVLHCFHVHHGLQPMADQWQAQVHDLALKLNAPCHSLRVCVQQASGLGLEAAARTARYDALAQLAHIEVMFS